MDIITIVLRFSLIFAMSFLFGIDRQRAHKPIGFGTFIFVAIGSCSLALVSLILYPENPLPLLGAIVTGVGFLGAGALIKQADKIFGATTAASIWLFACLGLVVGIGEYVISVILYSILWIVVIFDNFLEKRGIGSYRKKLVLTLNRNMHAAELAKILRTREYKINGIEINKKKKEYKLNLLVEGHKQNINNIPRILDRLDEVKAFTIE